MTLEGGGGSSRGTNLPVAERKTCKKCGGDAHVGGVRKCPFHSSLSDAEAKKRMSQLMAALARMSPDEVGRALQTDANANES